MRCVPANIRNLQHLFSIIPRQGADLGVAFSVTKTELIYWRTPKDRSDVSFAPIVVNNMLFPPSQAVRWLGYWLTPTIQSSIHFRRRLVLAQASFTTICQLSAASLPGAIGDWGWAPSSLSLPMAATFLSGTQLCSRNSTHCKEYFHGQLILFTPPPVALFSSKAHYHPFPQFVNTAASQPPTAWSTPFPVQSCYCPDS